MLESWLPMRHETGLLSYPADSSPLSLSEIKYKYLAFLTVRGYNQINYKHLMTKIGRDFLPFNI